MPSTIPAHSPIYILRIMQISCCPSCVAAFSEKLLVTMGARFSGPISILRNWTFCLFYVMAELWGSVVVSLLFWGFANQVCCFPDHLTINLTLLHAKCTMDTCRQ